ncbi:MAG: hypothetical protein N5P05_001724 [Chroococcopsis gigantea SAG 12.99]|jgi:diguanylate cyclase (GGDEF)-like protein/PAS domain S-box-containing protein|nr:hypothetical protein [Chroococcopsis gigantea SAG 12.99]
MYLPRKISGLLDRKKFLSWLVFIFIVLVIISGFQAGQWRIGNADGRIRQQLLLQTTVIAESISPEQVKSLSFTLVDRENPLFQRFHRQMKAYARQQGYRSIYTMTERNGKLIFGPENLEPEDILASPPGTIYEKPPPEFYRVFKTGKRGTVGPYKDEYGSFISAYAPVILPRTGEVLMVVAMDMEIDRWQQKINRLKLLPAFFTLLLIAILLLSREILSKKRKPGHEERSSGAAIYITTIFGFIFTLAIAGLLSENEHLDQQKTFDRIAETKATNVVRELLFLENDGLLTLARFFQVDEEVTREEFYRYSSSMVRAKKVQAWEWVERVPAFQKQQFETWVREQGIKDFFIFEKDMADRNIPAAGREFYYPVFYVEPLEENRKALGYDTGSEKRRRDALLEAETTKLSTATDPLKLIQEKGNHEAILVYHPVFKGEQQSKASGFVVLALRLQSMLSETVARSGYGDISACVDWLQIGVNKPPARIAEYCPAPSSQGRSQETPDKTNFFSSVYPVFIFGKAYALVLYPGPTFWAENALWKGKATALTGLLLTGVVTMLVGMVNNRRLVLERRVQERTAQLAENEERLRLALEASNQGLYDVDLATGEVFVSPQYALMLGYDPSQFRETVNSWRERLHPDEKEGVINTFESYSKGERPLYQVEFRQRTASGQWKWILSLGKIIEWDGTGQPSRMLGTHTDITERKLAEAKIKQLAYYDPLTGLPNRLLLFDTIDKALAEAKGDGHYGAVLFIDLDRFKTLNDARGHEAGDRLLREVAVRLKEALSTTDMVGRFGGDEFVVLLPKLSTGQDIANRLSVLKGEKILTYFSTPFIFQGEEIIIGASIGVSVFPKQKETVNDLLKEADTAMYQAKGEGRNRVRVFEAMMQIEAESRFTLEGEVRRAIEQKQFLLYLQPQVDMKGDLVGSEILVRWQHPVRGLVSPSAFIAMAEETGLIDPIGEWILWQTCKYLAKIRSAGSLLHVSVNVSPYQFCQPNFVKTIKYILASTGAEPTHLTLEVTESLIMENIHQTVATMLELRTLGINFSIDDFGTGYSSLAYLKRLPVNELKIDRSFVQDAPRDPNDAALVEAIISIARHFQLEIVAEGVETVEQAEFLKLRGCNFYQGYLYGKPVPIEEFDCFGKTGQNSNREI